MAKRRSRKPEELNRRGHALNCVCAQCRIDQLNTMMVEAVLGRQAQLFEAVNFVYAMLMDEDLRATEKARMATHPEMVKLIEAYRQRQKEGTLHEKSKDGTETKDA